MPTSETSLSALLGSGRPIHNRLIHIEISGLKSVEGDVIEDVTFYFSTEYDPMFTTVHLVRMLGGTLLANVPDDTINQLIHHFSLIAQQLIGACIVDPEMLALCLAQWVASKVILAMLDGSPINAKMQKRLADLSVSRDGGAAKGLADNLRDKLPDLEDCLLYGGSDDSGIRIKTPIKGEWHPESMVAGRQWIIDRSRLGFPGANSRVAVTRGGVQLRKPRRSWVGDPRRRR